MASYGSNAEVQRLAFGASDSNQDTRSASARDVATSFINAKLNYTSDLTTVPDIITRCANLLAAGLILTGQARVDSTSNHPFITLALSLLDELGEETFEGEQYTTIIAPRFRDYDVIYDTSKPTL